MESNANGVGYTVDDDTFNLEQSADIDLNPANPEGPELGTTANVSNLFFRL